MSDDPPQLMEDTAWWTPAHTGSWWILDLSGAVIVTGLVVAVVILYRRKKLPLPFLTPPSPSEVALKALGELTPFMTEAQAREFVTRISQILRTYLQGRFQLRAMHRSTEEFLREASEDERLSLLHRDLLANFLRQCDLVKFARRGMALPQLEELLLAARSFIQVTSEPMAAPEVRT